MDGHIKWSLYNGKLSQNGKALQSGSNSRTTRRRKNKRTVVQTKQLTGAKAKRTPLPSFFDGFDSNCTVVKQSVKTHYTTSLSVQHSFSGQPERMQLPQCQFTYPSMLPGQLIFAATHRRPKTKRAQHTSQRQSADRSCSYTGQMHTLLTWSSWYKYTGNREHPYRRLRIRRRKQMQTCTSYPLGLF